MKRRSAGVVASVLCAGLAVGCGDSPAGRSTPSLLDAKGEDARVVSTEFWIQLAAVGLVFALVAAILVASFVRERRRASEEASPHAHHAEGVAWVIVGGIALPVVVLSALFFVYVHDIARLSSQEDRGGPIVVDVIGHRWWWEIRYPKLRIATANQLVLPVGGRVALRVTSKDVIHSFWVPQLRRKIDAIPGSIGSGWISAQQAGIYRGVCSEFCGLQHARMQLLVQAMPQARFAEWVRNAQRAAPQPSTASERAGRDVFTHNACATCHTIRGTTAGGNFGPDLTHVGSRPAIAGAVLANTPGNMGGWIADPQHVKPGAEMPAVPLNGTQLRDVIAYLESLR
jgi:cytochrome c oxidase subunit 2